MKIPKPSEADKDFFLSVVPDDPAVQVKPMFGNLAAFVNGNMFAGLFGPALGVRLDAERCAELLGMEGAGPFGPAERPMAGYASLPAAWRKRPDLATAWVSRALDHARTLPPKAANPRKKSR